MVDKVIRVVIRYGAWRYFAPATKGKDDMGKLVCHDFADAPQFDADKGYYYRECVRQDCADCAADGRTARLVVSEADFDDFCRKLSRMRFDYAAINAAAS